MYLVLKLIHVLSLSYTWFIATIRKMTIVMSRTSWTSFPISIRYISAAHLHIVALRKDSARVWDRNVSTSARFSLAFEPDSAPAEDAAGERVPLEEEQHEHREHAGGEGEFAQRKVAVVARVEIRVI